jgi:hypothetical protein
MRGDLPQSAIMSGQQRASQEQFVKCSLSGRLYLTFTSFTSTGPVFPGHQQHRSHFGQRGYVSAVTAAYLSVAIGSLISDKERESPPIQKENG